MAKQIDVKLPPDLVIGDGWTLEWAAVDPTTGAAVAGVKVSSVNVVATDVSGGVIEAEPLGPFMLVPGPEA